MRHTMAGRGRTTHAVSDSQLPRAEAGDDEQQSRVGRVANPPVGTAGDDGLAGLDLDGGAKGAAQRRDRPDTQGESGPHHDDSRHPQRLWHPQRRRHRASAEGCDDRCAERHYDQDARGAIPVRTALALNALAHPHADFDQRPRHERQIRQGRHGALPEYRLSMRRNGRCWSAPLRELR
jgi:hypothetical protein